MPIVEGQTIEKGDILFVLSNSVQQLDVDLLFVEDGVAPNVFRRVLESLFERADWAPDRRLEERDLQAIHSARLMLHDLHTVSPTIHAL